MQCRPAARAGMLPAIPGQWHHSRPRQGTRPNADAAHPPAVDGPDHRTGYRRSKGGGIGWPGREHAGHGPPNPSTALLGLAMACPLSPPHYRVLGVDGGMSGGCSSCSLVGSTSLPTEEAATINQGQLSVDRADPLPRLEPADGSLVGAAVWGRRGPLTTRLVMPSSVPSTVMVRGLVASNQLKVGQAD